MSGTADRTVTSRLVADTTGYDGPIVASSKNTSALAAAQRDAAAAAKVAASEQRATALASREAGDAAAAASRQVVAAKVEQAAAAKAAGAADAAAAKALTDADRAEAASAQAAARARQAAADQSLSAAKANAAAAADTAAASRTAATEAAKDAAAKRDVAMAAKDAATAEAADAAATEAAAKKRSEAYTSTGKIVTGAGLALAAGFVLAEKATSDFKKSLSGVQAVSNASAADMNQLSAAALQAGKATAFTGTEAADAEGELVKAGVSVKDVLGGALQGSLNLAAAGQLDLADSATIAANAMNTFGLKGKDVTHIADVYAAAANKSAADVTELAYAQQQGGLVAAQTGLTFEDTTAILAAFADRGLKGADAGTSLKTMLEKLNAPTSQAATLMQSLGIQTYDAQGKFVGITSVAGQLHDKLGPLTDAQRNQALATIFGSDAIRAASVLYNLGADGVKGYSDAVNDNGAAQRMAAEQMDNFSGDLKQLKGSIDVTLIQGGSGANAVLREMAQTATKVVNGFANLPKPLQEAAVGFSGGAGTALLLVGGMTSLAGKATSTKKTLEAVAEASSGMKGALASAGSFMAGPWGIAIAGAATVIGIFASNHSKAKIAVDDFTSSIQQDGDAIGQTTTKTVADDLAKKGLIVRYQELGISGNTLTDAVLGNADALAAVTKATNDAVAASKPQIVAAGRTASSINTHADALKNDLATILAYKDGVAGQIRTEQQATAATQGSTAATGESAIATAKATQAAKDAAATALAQAAGQRAVAEAEAAAGSATGATTEKRKTGTAASSRLAEAIREQALANDDGGAADKAAAAAADQHTQSLYKTAASAKAAADAAAKNKDANASDAKATADAAEAAAEASDVHQSGVKWLLAVANAEAGASGSARDLDSSVTDEVAAMKDAKDKASSLKDAMDALNGIHIAASKAAIDVQQRVADLTKALHENGTTLDITTESGRANVSAIDDMASAANAHAQAVAEESGSIDAGNKALDASRTQFDAVLKSAGLSTGQIEEFNKTLLNTPKLAPVTLEVKADTSAAAEALQALESKYGGTGIVFGGGPSGKRIVSGFSAGGLVKGAGSPTSDSNMIAVSDEEYVVNAAAVARPGMLEALNAINFGTGTATVIKPMIPMHSLAAPATPPASRNGPALNIENYYENGSPPATVAAELAWLATARGSSW